jgi:hypothetical protein
VRDVLGYDTTGDGRPGAFDTSQDGRIDVRAGTGAAGQGGGRALPGWDDGGERRRAPVASPSKQRSPGLSHPPAKDDDGPPTPAAGRALFPAQAANAERAAAKKQAGELEAARAEIAALRRALAAARKTAAERPSGAADKENVAEAGGGVKTAAVDGQTAAGARDLELERHRRREVRGGRADNPPRSLFDRKSR